MDVDAVYIPLPTGLRKEWVLRAAAAGKHIICEKPCAPNAAELDEMLTACKKNDVQFMDGVMFMHSPRLAKIRESLLDEKNVGQIRRISSAFSFYAGEGFFKDNIRVDAALEPAGCIGDLGWYCIRFALWTLNWQMPHAVTGRIFSQSGSRPCRRNSPANCCLTVVFPPDSIVHFFAAKQQWAHVSGRNGWVRVPGFVHPLDSYEPALEVNDVDVRVAGTKWQPAGC